MGVLIECTFFTTILPISRIVSPIGKMVVKRYVCREKFYWTDMVGRKIAAIR